MSNSNLYGKSKTKKMSAEIDPKYLPPKQLDHNGNEIPWSNDPNTIAYLRRYAENAKQSELNAKLFEKQREEELREMEEREKRQREESERRREANAKTPERQFNMLLSGKSPRYNFGNYAVPMYPAFVGIPSKIHQQEGYGIKVISIEPGLSLLKEEYNACKIIRLDEQMHNRLNEFAKDGETILDLMNRLLDIATTATEAKQTQQQQQQ
jgi:hypothetical protein